MSFEKSTGSESSREAIPELLKQDLERASAEVNKDVNVRAHSLLVRLAVLVDRNGEGFSEEERAAFLEEIDSVNEQLQSMPAVQLYDTIASIIIHSGVLSDEESGK